MRKSFFFQMAVKEVAQADPNSKVVVIEGFASTPDLDRYRDIVEPTAFKDALELYMKNPVVLYQHDPSEPVGNVTSAVVTDKGLKIVAEVKDEETKQEVLDGRMRALSIGYIPLESTLQHEDGTPFNAEIDNVWDNSLVRVIKKLDLVEISIVSTPANGNALFTVAKSVKQYFAEVVTKSFGLNKKDAESAETAKTSEETAKTEETADHSPTLPETAKTDGGVQNEVAEGVGEGNAKEDEKEKSGDQKVDAEKPADVNAEGAKSAEVDEELKEEIANEVKPEASAPANQEAAEKDGAKPSAEGGEAPKGDEPSAEAKPAESANAEGEKSLKLSSKSVTSLPELVEAGLAVEDEKGVELPESVVGLIRKLITVGVTNMKRADELQAKLDKIPAKQGLVVTGQYSEPTEEGANALGAKTKTSEWFASLFNNAK